MKVGEHLGQEHILTIVMTCRDKRSARRQNPNVDPTFRDRPSDQVIADALLLEIHPHGRVDRERVSTKHRDHTQEFGIESRKAGPHRWVARADGNLAASMGVCQPNRPPSNGQIRRFLVGLDGRSPLRLRTDRGHLMGHGVAQIRLRSARPRCENPRSIALSTVFL